jgi:Uma2 family endonuclease
LKRKSYRLYLSQHNIGYVVGDNSDFDLAPGYIFQPDIAFISKERLPEIPKKFMIAPDLAAEIASPSNTTDQLIYKAETYIRFGTRIVWLIYPDTQAVHVYRPAEAGSLNVRRLTADDMLDGGDVLPELKISVKKIFPSD